MALGLGIAFVIGVLIFWAWPAYQRYRSPIGEVSCEPIVVNYFKESFERAAAGELACELAKTWRSLLERLDIDPQRFHFPQRIYVHAYRDIPELLRGLALRSGEATHIAEVDILAAGPFAGALGRLACSLAFKGPGNPVFPRGLSLVLNWPGRRWAAEAAVYSGARAIDILFSEGERLLTKDPWERLFFEVNAPWASAAPTLATLSAYFQEFRSEAYVNGRWDVIAAGLAAFVMEEFGGRGIEAFWLSADWQQGAARLGLTTAEFRSMLDNYLSQELVRTERSDPLFSARKELLLGRPTKALELAAGATGEEAATIRGLAYLALGDVRSAYKSLSQVGSLAPVAESLSSLLTAKPLAEGRLVLVSQDPAEAKPLLSLTEAALKRAAEFWQLEEGSLPERIVIYQAPPPRGPSSALPSQVIFVSQLEAIPGQVVRLVLELASSGVLPQMDALVDGLALWFVYPDLDFRAEAAAILREGRWVSLTQKLGDYPVDIRAAEAGAFVSYLRERYGEEGIREYWRSLSQGSSPFKAALQVFGLGLEQLDADLRRWIAGD
jgi:hypothetical protein